MSVIYRRRKCIEINVKPHSHAGPGSCILAHLIRFVQPFEFLRVDGVGIAVALLLLIRVAFYCEFPVCSTNLISLSTAIDS